MTKNGLQGFYCPKSGRNEPFQFCWSKCQNTCKPLPVLLSLARQDRASEQNVYHVTEILNPPQQVFLARNNPYYRNPDSLIDMHVGTAWHEKLAETKKYVKELGLEDDYLMEDDNHFELPFMWNEKANRFRKFTDITPQNTLEPLTPIILSGTPDLIVKSTKTLWDYKIMKFYYSFKYISEGNWEGNTIPMQLNIYRVYQYPSAEAIKIFVYLKDYKLNFADKYDLSQTETLQVPMIPDDKVKKKVLDLLGEHVLAQKTGKPRQCKEEELWINRAGEPLRCMYYCAPSDSCPQLARWKEKK